jgi:putative transposase
LGKECGRVRRSDCRLIGTIRREYLDRTLFWNMGDLERKLEGYKAFYNQYRCHTGLAGMARLNGGIFAP